MNPFSRALGHVIRCRDVTRLISQLQEREGSAWERWKLSMHLSVCTACSRFNRQVGFLREAMRRYRS